MYWNNEIPDISKIQICKILFICDNDYFVHKLGYIMQDCSPKKQKWGNTLSAICFNTDACTKCIKKWGTVLPVYPLHYTTDTMVIWPAISHILHVEILHFWHIKQKVFLFISLSTRLICKTHKVSGRARTLSMFLILEAQVQISFHTMEQIAEPPSSRWSTRTDQLYFLQIPKQSASYTNSFKTLYRIQHTYDEAIPRFYKRITIKREKIESVKPKYAQSNGLRSKKRLLKRMHV